MHRGRIVAFILIGLSIIGTIFVALPRITSPLGSLSTKLRITTSFYPLYFFTQAIARDDATVVNLMPAGAEPHDYEPTPQAIMELERSQMIVVNGELEPWFTRLRTELAANGRVLVTTGNDLSSKQSVDEGLHGWLSPRLAPLIVERIYVAMARMDPNHAAQYRSHTDQLLEQLTDLDLEFKRGLQGCQQHSFITAHSAFGSWAAAYGLTQIGIAGLSPADEPSPQALAKLTDFARTQQIKYIFFEALVNPKFSDTLARELGVQTLVLNPLEGLTAAELAAGKTYFTEMRQNLVNLRLALSCPPLQPIP